MSQAGQAPRIAIVGGGIAGLAAAWELSDAVGPGTRVVVFESASRFGGKLRTGPFGGRDVDLGPDAFVARRPEALALCTELGLDPDLVAPGARRAYVWARGHLRPLPAGLALGVPTRFGPLARSGICSPVGLVRPALDLLRSAMGPTRSSSPSDPDRAVGDIVRERLGREVTTRLAGPLVGGIHAGTVDTMSAAAVFPALLTADRRPGSLMRALRPTASPPGAGASAAGAAEGDAGLDGRGAAPVFLSLRGGLGRLVDRLTGALDERGVELRRDTAVLGIERGGGGDRGWVIRADGEELDCDGIVVAVPSPTAAALLRPHDAALADSLEAVTYSSVALVTMRFGEGAVDHRLDGSGFLVPRGDRRHPDPLLTACTWLTSKWPELRRDGDVLLRVSVGRQGDNRYESLDDNELTARCVAELGVMMGPTGAPVETLVTRWPLAFPQYEVGHLARVASIESATARLASVALAGAALHGVGVPACIGSGRRAARAVLGGIGAASGMAR
jgi:oxygen-dependent protoporphyrinogen oxidase